MIQNPDREVTQSPSLERLVAFEEVSWAKEHQASRDDLVHRLEAFPEGIFLLSVEGEDVSQVTFSPKKIPPFEEIQGFEQMRDIPVDRNSKRLWITNLATRVGKRGGGYLTTLFGHSVQWAREQGYEEIVTGISCYGLKESMEQGAAVSPEDWLNKGMNPALRAIEKVAEDVGCKAWHSDPIPGYWEEDTDSLGYGVLVRMVL